MKTFEFIWRGRSGRTYWGIVIVFLQLFVLSGTCGATVEVGQVDAIKGNVTIDREKNILEAKHQSPLFLEDSIETKENSRVKMRFIDDSVLTLSEKTHLKIREYMYDKSEHEGNSIFELLDGHLRTLVGKGDLEIHTPTAVAAARGTFFFVRVRIQNNMVVTEIFLLEGTLEVKNRDGGISGTVTLSPGMYTAVEQFEAPTIPVPISEVQLKEILNCCNIGTAKQ